MARRRRRRGKKIPQEPVEAKIESLSHDGRGVTHIEGKTTFIDGALADEKVRFVYTAQQRKHDEGKVIEVLEASAERVKPRCPHFGVCGGCCLQHQSEKAQIESKQQALLETLKRIGKVTPEQVWSPLINQSTWGYRQKARLGAKYVTKKEKLLVGFREKGKGFITDMQICHVLVPQVGQLIKPLADLIQNLSIFDKTPQIEVAVDDHSVVLIFRVLAEPNTQDIDYFNAFAKQYNVVIYLQSGGLDTVKPLEKAVDLQYQLTEFDLTLSFLPTDFTQVNQEMNQKMISRAIQTLDLNKGDKVLDLFCGIGNFTLPLATKAGQVIGIEGDSALVERARMNAQQNKLDNVSFYTANLYGKIEAEPWMQEKWNKVLLDPPRSGALEVLPYLKKWGAKDILYVSCYPGTLARDADILVNQQGYRLISAGIMDMFPHTAHVESMAYFSLS